MAKQPTKPNATETDTPPGATVSEPLDPQRWQHQLERITGHNASIKQATVLAVLLKEFTGIPVGWDKRGDIGAKSTWFESWRHDPVIQDVMAAIRRDVLAERVADTARAVDEALHTVQLAAPEAARALVDLLQQKQNHWLIKQVAEAILDRASIATSNKGNNTAVSEIAGIHTLLQQVYGDNEPNTEPGLPRTVASGS